MPNDFIKKIRSIDSDGRQLKLDFETSHAGELDEVIAAVERFAVVSEPVAFDRLLEYFSGLPYLWEKGQTAYQTARLVIDRKIDLACEGTRMQPKQALEHLSRPARWHRLQVLRPDTAQPSELKAAKKLCLAVFRRPVALNQEAIANGLRRGLYAWHARLNGFRRQAAGGRLPGVVDIDVCQRLVQTLQAVEDPRELVRAALKKEEALRVAGDAVKQLTFFYKHQVPQWEALLSALSEYMPFRENLEEEGMWALDRLELIRRDPSPYRLVSEISDLTAAVKIAYRNLLADHRVRAEESLEKMVAQVRLALDRRGADPQLCIRALRPIRQIGAKLAWAPRVPDIRSLLSAAENHFEDIIEELASDPAE